MWDRWRSHTHSLSSGRGPADMPKLPKKTGSLLFLIGCGLFGLWFGWSQEPDRATIEPSFREGTEIQVVFLVSPTCAVCASERFQTVARTAMEKVRQRELPEGHQISFVFVGIGHDLNAIQDLADRLGSFEEMVIGHGWVNMGAMRYFWRDIPAEGSTPQVVITRRTLRNNDVSRGIAPSEEELFLRLVGLEEITSWADQGYRLPGLGLSSTS